MRSPAKETRDPNLAGGSAAKKRGAAGPLEASPAKKQQQRKKPSKKDRRRVSFAPDQELTLVHHFVKDDDYGCNSGDRGRVLAQYEEEEEQQAVLRARPSMQHPALVGEPMSGGGAGDSYQPGFWHKSVPENSPLSDRMPLDSPGMVSMELTEPTVQPASRLVVQVRQGTVGEVTAGLPSLGALADADEWMDGSGEPAGWGAAAAPDNVTGGITAALPGLGALVAEDEDGTAGMDLTQATGRVLEHNPQQRQQQQQQHAGRASPAAAPPSSPLMAVVPSGGSAQPAHPALAPVELTRRGSAEQLDPTVAISPVSEPAPGQRSRLSAGSDELGRGAAARGAQLNKWGFAPGADDTLDINLEMHGRMIMGDQTFSRLYSDNTTGEAGKYGGGRPSLDLGGGDDATTDSLLGRDLGRSAEGMQEGWGAAEDLGREEEVAAEQGASQADVPPSSAAAAAASPALSHAVSGAHGQAAFPSPGAAAAPAAAGAAPNWAAPAFLPPYMQSGRGASGALSDHPALVHSPGVSGSSLNTMDTRRTSVGVDIRRASIGSRRFSMQDATGRLLADFKEEAEEAAAAAAAAAGQQPAVPHPALPAAADAPIASRTRRRSSLPGRDVTEKLLVDDSLQQQGAEVEEEGPLADLKRQMRMLSQGSPALAPHVSLEQVAAVQQPVAAPQAELLAAALEVPAAVQAQASKTPRQRAVSLGYADSHNPATAAAPRTGGTTRLLLQETVQLGGQQGYQDVEELGQLGGMAEGEEDEAAGTAGLTGELGGGIGGAAPRTHGTTRLLADMTMASVAGAMLLGREQQGTPEVGQQLTGDGLTGFSLDEFDRPPDLPGGLQQAQQQQQGQQQQGQQVQQQQGQQVQQVEGMEVEQAQLAGQHPQQGDEYASPALPAHHGQFGAGYPLGEMSEGESIPGGPKLHRTPVTVRTATQPRSARGTPHSSNPRSVHSGPHQHLLQPHATPGTYGTRGSHRLARTPGSMRPAAAAYPVESGLTGDNQIPGGPKLARTPLGRTPATGCLLAPGSAVAQHQPGSGRAVHFAAGPGSASVGRYPGSAVALHRGGMTPQLAPQPMTFQDFAKLAEVQFLDNLRRGASINYADLQPNPIPQNLADAYRLLTIISPQVTTLENGIRILQEEVQARRVSAADAEQLVGQVNPAAFQRVAAADDEQLDDLRAHVGLLKKVCRQKAVYCLKDVRRQMEESRGARLQRNLEALQADLAFAQDNKEQMAAVARAAEQYIAEQHSRMAAQEAGTRAEAERRATVCAMRRSVGEENAANEERRQRLRKVQERVAQLRVEHAALHREREALRRHTDALQMTLMQSKGQGGVGRDSTPAAVLKKLEEVELLKSCAGWQLEAAREDPVSGEAMLRMADLFRLRLTVSRTTAAASVELLPPDLCAVPADRRALLAALAGCPEGAAAPAELQVSEPSGAKVAALVQATTARLSRIADLAAELDGLRLAHPALSDVCCRPDGTLALSFINLDAEVKFGVSLQLPASYPAGPVQAQARVWFGGAGQITQQVILQAVAATAEAPGRLRAICSLLSKLAREAMPRPALSQDAAFCSNWQNPLFGGQPAMSSQS